MLGGGRTIAGAVVRCNSIPFPIVAVSTSSNVPIHTHALSCTCVHLHALLKSTLGWFSRCLFSLAGLQTNLECCSSELGALRQATPLPQHPKSPQSAGLAAHTLSHPSSPTPSLPLPPLPFLSHSLHKLCGPLCPPLTLRFGPFRLSPSALRLLSDGSGYWIAQVIAQVIAMESVIARAHDNIVDQLSLSKCYQIAKVIAKVL